MKNKIKSDQGSYANLHKQKKENNQNNKTSILMDKEKKGINFEELNDWVEMKFQKNDESNYQKEYQNNNIESKQDLNIYGLLPQNNTNNFINNNFEQKTFNPIRNEINTNFSKNDINSINIQNNYAMNLNNNNYNIQNNNDNFAYENNYEGQIQNPKSNLLNQNPENQNNNNNKNINSNVNLQNKVNSQNIIEENYKNHQIMNESPYNSNFQIPQQMNINANNFKSDNNIEQQNFNNNNPNIIKNSNIRESEKHTNFTNKKPNNDEYFPNYHKYSIKLMISSFVLFFY